MSARDAVPFVNTPLAFGNAWSARGVHRRQGGLWAVIPAPDAHALELQVFDDGGSVPTRRVEMQGPVHGLWTAWVPSVAAGALYGLRAHGPWAPEQGLRFNPAKLLLDPWAESVAGRFDGSEYHVDHDGNGRPDPRDNAAFALKAQVVEPLSPLLHARPMARSAADSVFYEAHVRSVTRQHPRIPEGLRGTYLGLSHPAFTEHLLKLGVTTVSLMPMMHWLDEPRLLRMGLRNHWGYNPVAWRAPEPRLAADPRAVDGLGVREQCQLMVQQLHAAGLEVVLDVVFNHSAESDLDGPTLHWRGLANRQAYHHAPHEPGRYENWSGCGNSLNLRDPHVLAAALDALRHWVTVYGIDGFRFDLAPMLGRSSHGFDAAAPFFLALQQDPVLSGVRCIAEPWDIGPGGYRLGQFPAPWQEWNDRFRDTVRRFWLQGHVPRAHFADVLAGCSAQFQPSGRPPWTSLNLLTAHDGFTLRDLLTYEHKRNQANGEGNRDGHDHNHGWNCGSEGATDDHAVCLRRARLTRALSATLAVAAGTPQWLAGDEIGHTQGGNNNAYCQDNATTWLNWELGDMELTDHVAQWMRLRHRHDALRRSRWLEQGQVRWLRSDGVELHAPDWHDTATRTLGVLHLSPVATGEPEAERPALLLLFNAAPVAQRFVLPGAGTSPTASWVVTLCSEPTGCQGPQGGAIEVPPHTVVALEPTERAYS